MATVTDKLLQNSMKKSFDRAERVSVSGSGLITKVTCFASPRFEVAGVLAILPSIPARWCGGRVRGPSSEDAGKRLVGSGWLHQKRLVNLYFFSKWLDPTYSLCAFDGYIDQVLSQHLSKLACISSMVRLDDFCQCSSLVHIQPVLPRKDLKHVIGAVCEQTKIGFSLFV